MNVIIKTELDKLPHDCYKCPYAQNGKVWKYVAKYDMKFVDYRYACMITNKAMTSTKRNRFCPLVEIEE